MGMREAAGGWEGVFLRRLAGSLMADVLKLRFTVSCANT